MCSQQPSDIGSKEPCFSTGVRSGVRVQMFDWEQVWGQAREIAIYLGGQVWGQVGTGQVGQMGTAPPY